MDKITVEKMAFYGYHGLYAEEKVLGQRFYVDVVAYLDIKRAAISGDMNDSVNYVHIFELVQSIVEGKPFTLLESLTEHIASEVLAQFPLIQEVLVKVVKPHPPAPIHFSGVAIEIRRKRTDENMGAIDKQ